MKIKPPVSRNYIIKFDEQSNWANVDLTNIKDKKAFNNSIINTIIACYQNFPQHILKGISFTYSHQQTELYEILCRQMGFFNLQFKNIIQSSDDFSFNEKWKTNINKGLDIDFSEWEKLWSGFKGVMPYKTVTEKHIQLRYLGYQLACFNPKASNPTIKSFVLKNNNNGAKDFAEHYNYISQKRNQINDKEKLEHYIESILLQNIQNNTLDICGTKIEKLFNSKVNFQFPTLWRTGSAKRSGNSPKYADIFAKHNNRPVIMELKVHHNTGNSRGEYVFNAFGQLLNYFVFLKAVFSNPKQTWDKHLIVVKKLDWNQPILYIIVDDLGDDNTAIILRDYIEKVKQYFTTSLDVRFVEIAVNYKQGLKFIHEI
jgi:hypothetical protein